MTKCDKKDYKVRQVGDHKMRQVELQSVTGITK